MPPIVTIRDLHYAYPPPIPGAVLTQVLRGIDLEVAAGEFVALVGRVGAGKTTLCMALNGLAPHATGGTIRGQVTVAGLDTRRHPVAELARTVGLVFQDPEAQLTQMRVEDEIAFGLENLGLPPDEIEERVTWALDAVGLAAQRDRSPTHLSGGEKQRVALAAVLAMRPRVLVLDEPTANLDPAGKAAIFTVLARLARQRQIAIVIATQEMERVARHADRVLVLHEGRVALAGPPAEIFAQVARLQEWGLGVPQLAELAELLAQRTGYRYRFTGVSDATAQLGADLANPPGPVKPDVAASPGTQQAATSGLLRQRQPLRSPRSRPPVGPLNLRPGAPAAQPSTAAAQIVLESVSYTYPDGTPALHDVNLTIAAGEFVALLGPNGSGKTTLAKQLNGLLRPQHGRVKLEGRDTRGARVAELAHTVGYVFQNPDHQIFAATVEEEIAFGLRLQGLAPAIVAQRVAEALDRFRLASHAHLPPAVLGSGQRRQVTLAAALAMRPRVLVLDEPTGGLDGRGRQELMGALAVFHAGGGTVLLITHDMRPVAEFADRAVVLAGGRVRFDGSPGTLFQQHDLLAETRLSAPPVVRLAQRLVPYGFDGDVLSCAEFAAAWQERPMEPPRHDA